MSRFKLYALAQAMLGAMLSSNGQFGSSKSRGEIETEVNRKFGGVLFSSGGPMPTSRLNQRQRRKQWRQAPHMRKKQSKRA